MTHGYKRRYISMGLFQNFMFGKSFVLVRLRADLSRGRFRAALRRLAVTLFQRGLRAGFRGLAGWGRGTEGDFGRKSRFHRPSLRPGADPARALAAGVRVFLGCGIGEMVFCLEERVINGDAGHVYSFTEFYVLPRHFALNANTVKEENGIKKIF